MVQVANTSLHLFPTSYDGTKPFPLLIALHACGNPNTQFVSLTNNTGFATKYVRTFPNTPDSGQCWSNYNTDISRVLTQYDDLMANYCIDQNRVFATGHSSGAQIAGQHPGPQDRRPAFEPQGRRARRGRSGQRCVPIPVMYIAGKMDNQRSADSARNTVARFRTANMCVRRRWRIRRWWRARARRPTVDPGCIIYDGCAVPTIWCSHNDPQYSGTQHGVPCFAMKAAYDFFASVP